MGNILIIKHGSFGDIAQVCGAIKDISENHEQDQIHILTTKPYFELFRKNPFVHNVILNKRLSRFNLIYLYLLMRTLKKLNTKKVYDLQNSSRTKFYKNFLLKKCVWSSTDTTVEPGQNKKDFNKQPVLKRMKAQLTKSKIKTLHIYKPDLAWSFVNI